jgi:hypothetical protein
LDCLQKHTADSGRWCHSCHLVCLCVRMCVSACVCVCKTLM